MKIKNQKTKKTPKLRFPGFSYEWGEKKLGEIAEIKKGKQLNRNTLSLDGSYPVINGGVNSSGFTDKWNMKENTISISEGGNSCGYVNLLKEKFWCGGHCYVLKIKKEADLNFLYQLLKFLEKRIMRLRVGSGLPNIQKGDIGRIKIHLPHKQEQQKIASFLSSLDDKIENINKKITLAQKFKKGLLQGLFV